MVNEGEVASNSKVKKEVCYGPEEDEGMRVLEASWERNRSSGSM